MTGQKVKLTAAGAVRACTAVRSLLAKRLPIKVKYLLGRIESVLAKEAAQVESAKEHLYREAGAEEMLDPKTGATILVPPQDKIAQIASECKDIDDTEIEVEVPKVKLSMFGEFTDEGNELLFIMDLIEDDTERAA